jgi:hypothetical protein
VKRFLKRFIAEPAPVITTPMREHLYPSDRRYHAVPLATSSVDWFEAHLAAQRLRVSVHELMSHEQATLLIVAGKSHDLLR